MNEIGLSKHMDSEQSNFPKNLVQIDCKKYLGLQQK